MDRPEPVDVAEWHHNVTTRCKDWAVHEGDDAAPHPCPECYSIETLTRRIPWCPPYTHDRELRSAAAAGFRLVHVTDEERREVREVVDQLEGRAEQTRYNLDRAAELLARAYLGVRDGENNEQDGG